MDALTATCKAVFLSYASQDAEAALRLCSALRAAGIEVWFEQSALRGGDAWDLLNYLMDQHGLSRRDQFRNVP